jgi:hypothetical protein
VSRDAASKNHRAHRDQRGWRHRSSRRRSRLADVASGAGRLLSRRVTAMLLLELLSNERFDDGLVQLRYRVHSKQS